MSNTNTHRINTQALTDHHDMIIKQVRSRLESSNLSAYEIEDVIDLIDGQTNLFMNVIESSNNDDEDAQ